MADILTTQVTELLTAQLGRAPTAAEIANGIKSPWSLAITHNTLVPGQSVYSLSPGEDIQTGIDKLNENGGGILYLQTGTYTTANDLVLYNNVSIQGQGFGTIIDFGGGAYSMQLNGSNAYSDGTISINANDTAVVGSGTTFTPDMEGRYIRLQDYWYLIDTVTDDTNIVIDEPYAGSDLSGASYYIADTISGITLSNFVVQNSTASLITCSYFDGLSFNGMGIYTAPVGLELLYGSGPILRDDVMDGCDVGLSITDTPSGQLDDVTLLNGTNGIVVDTINNYTFFSCSIQNMTGDGFSLTSIGDLTIDSFTVENVGGSGFNFVSGSRNTALNNHTIRNCSADGIRLTASTDTLTIGTGDLITGNGGYGVNIMDSSCDNNTIVANIFSSNSSGAVNDSGTGTLIRSNQGVADN